MNPSLILNFLKKFIKKNAINVSFKFLKKNLIFSFKIIIFTAYSFKLRSQKLLFN